jgi:hypothetical protein
MRKRWGMFGLMKRVVGRTLLIAGAIAVAPGAALAVPLPIGDTAITGTSVALRPELAGPIIEDVLTPYEFVGSGGQFLTGEVQNRVVRSVDGTLDFYWRILADDSSTGEITAFRVGGFDAFALDGDWRIDGLGTVAPDIARNFGGGFVNFLFPEGGGVGPDESSRFFFLDTEATAYAATGLYDLLCADSGCISPPFTTFAPSSVPEPSTLLFLGAGLAGLGLWGRRKFKARS